MEVNARYVYSMKQQPSNMVTSNYKQHTTKQAISNKTFKKNNSINTTIQQSHKPTKVNNDNLFKQAHQS